MCFLIDFLNHIYKNINDVLPIISKSPMLKAILKD